MIEKVHNPALLAILIAIIVSALLIVIYSLICTISPMPSSGKAKNAIVKLLMGHRSDATVVDLGSGWGTLAAAISLTFPLYRVIGYEYSPIPFLYSFLISKITGYTNCHYFRRNFLKCSLEGIDIVVCYLCTPLMNKLKPKFEQELDSGTLVISNTFAVPGWKPTETVILNDMYKTRIYVYRR